MIDYPTSNTIAHLAEQIVRIGAERDAAQRERDENRNLYHQHSQIGFELARTVERLTDELAAARQERPPAPTPEGAL